MQRVLGIVLFVALAANFARTQQTTPSAPSQLAGDRPERVKVYVAGSGATPPQLLPLSLPPIAAGKCKNKVDDNVTLSVLVDTKGLPRNLTFLKPLGNDMDKFAIQAVSADRFSPATYDGVPVVFGLSLQVDLKGCVEQKKDTTGKKTLWYSLRSQPEQEFKPLAAPSEEVVLAPSGPSGSTSLSDSLDPKLIGSTVKAPVPLNQVVAEFSDAARKAKYGGVCMISLVVDRNGMPQNVQVVRHLDYGLDQNAIDAANRYRFKPAMKDGEPIPVTITFQVEFRLY